MIVRVALPQQACFDYSVPDEWREQCGPGVAVEVPLGPRRLVGYVMETLASSTHKLRPIRRVLSDVPALSLEQLKIAGFISSYYLVDPSDVVALMVPSPVRRRVLEHVALTDAGKRLVKAEPAHALAGLTRLRTVRAIKTKLGLSLAKTQELLAAWQEKGLVTLSAELSASARLNADLVAHGVYSDPVLAVPPPPSDEQARALAALAEAQAQGGYHGFLLWGVTGSGKTEVYLATIAAALARGKTALVLVPEIGLTPQVRARFEARFGTDVVTVHSSLTTLERRSAWMRVQAGRAHIVVGPRSALFVPLGNLGVVIVDEEHDESYKQDETPRYHARDVALVRAQDAGAIAVLGSATPSLESLHNVRLKKLTLLEMHTRPAGGKLPDVTLVPLLRRLDPNQPAPKATTKSGREIPLITPALNDALAETIARGEQAILFLNRRGFAPFILCQSCNDGFRCEQCSVSLTHHLRRNVLLCHYCGHVEAVPVCCKKCRSPHLRTMGSGTERLEIELKNAFPTYRVGRLDRDVAETPRELKDTLSAFRNGTIDVLVGTQMVAKGHDFPNVTLVGAVMADAALSFPDFRASERTAQLLVQVAGRAGRGTRPGRVLVQTCHGEHPAVLAASTHDYATFAWRELDERQELEYPPHSRLILLRLEGEDRAEVNRSAQELGRRLIEGEESDGQSIAVLGPAPCPLERLRGQWRVMILIKAKSAAALRRRVQVALAHTARAGTTKLVIDVDPVSML